jgi:hypothetical protein
MPFPKLFPNNFPKPFPIPIPIPFRGPKSIRVPVTGLAAALFTTLLAACSGTASAPKPQPEWRLVPEATVLVENRQFFLYGRRLDSVTITLPPSVTMVQGKSNNGGRVLSLHFRVMPLGKDSLAQGESVGLREVRVRTPDTSLVLPLKIVDEALPR